MRKIFLSLFIFLVIGLTLGCGPRRLAMGSERVYLSHEPAPQTCKFLGPITNANVHGDMLLQSSLEDLEKDDINFLKNEGAKLNANTVVLNSHEVIATQYRRPKHQLYYTINSHSINANAYLCQPEVLDQLNSDFINFKINQTPLI